MNKAGLMMQRPAGDATVAANLPDEKGEPLNQNDTDDHDVLTGSNMRGPLDGHQSRLDVQRLDEQRGIDRATDVRPRLAGAQRHALDPIAPSGRLREGHLDRADRAARWA